MGRGQGGASAFQSQQNAQTYRDAKSMGLSAKDAGAAIRYANKANTTRGEALNVVKLSKSNASVKASLDSALGRGSRKGGGQSSAPSIDKLGPALRNIPTQLRTIEMRKAGMPNSAREKVNRWLDGKISGSASKVARASTEAQNILARYAGAFRLN